MTHPLIPLDRGEYLWRHFRERGQWITKYSARHPEYEPDAKRALVQAEKYWAGISPERKREIALKETS